MTKREIIDNAILKATQSNPSDDHEIERDQVVFWIQELLPAMIAAEIENERKLRNPIPAIYITYEECKDLEIEDAACGGDCQDRFYITLSGTILDLAGDAGLVLIRTDEGIRIPIVSLGDIETLRNMPFGKPSSEKPVAYRIKEKIFIEGYKEADIDFEALTVWYVARPDVTSVDEDAQIPVSDKLAPLLNDSLSDKLRQMLYGSQQDTQNDGVWVPAPQYHNLIRKENELRSDRGSDSAG